LRQLLMSEFVTIDGVMQAPGGPGESWDGGVDHGGWSTGYWDDRMNQIMAEITARPFDLLLGRKTYEVFAAQWSNTDQPGAEVFNNATKHVASRTLDRVEWQNSILIKGDPVDYVHSLKASDGPEIQVHGSGNLVQTLLEHDLLDACWLFVFPVVLGSGRRLFGHGTIPVGFRVTDVKTPGTGVIAIRYERTGAIGHGSFAVPQATAVRKRQAREG
jgi:dihydrofolate reductase